MAADPRGPGDPLEQLRADRERRRAEERADAPSSSSVPPPDWRHDTLELDLDGLRHEPAGPPPVVDGSVLRSRTHGGGWRALRRGSSAAAKKVRRVRVPAGLVVGLVLVVGAGATSAALDGNGSGPQTSPLQTTSPRTGTGTTQSGTTTSGDQPLGSVRVETGGSTDGSDAGRAPEQDAGPPSDPQAGPAAGGPGGPGAPVGQAAGPGGGGPAGGPGSGPAAGPGAGPAGAPGRP